MPGDSQYYYSDNEQQSGSSLLTVLAAVGLTAIGGFAAYRAGLLRPVIQRAMVLGGDWRPGRIQDITTGIKRWAYETAEEPLHRAVRTLPEYIQTAVATHAASTRRIRPFIFTRSAREMSYTLRTLGAEWAAAGASENDIIRGNTVIKQVAREAILSKMSVSRETQEALMKHAGVRFATLADVQAARVAELMEVNRAAAFLEVGGRPDIMVDPLLFITREGQFIDLRHLAEHSKSWLEALQRHFALPFVNFNPVSLFYLDELLEMSGRPVIYAFDQRQIQPFLTGTQERLGHIALFAGGRVYGFSNIPRSPGDLTILNPDREGILLPGHKFIALEYLRSMAGLPTRVYEPYDEGIRGFFARVMRAVDLGFQDVYRWNDPLLGPMRYDEGFASINDLYNRISERIIQSRFIRPWRRATVPQETVTFINQEWIYLNKSDWGSLESVITQLFAGRHDLRNVSPITLGPYIGVARMNVATGAAGAGLSFEHTGSTFDIFANMFLRRALILGGLAFSWHYLNYLSEKVTGERPEYLMADAYVGTTEFLSHVGEKIHLNEFVKRLKKLTPGSEQITELPVIKPLTIWMDKTEEEMREYWERGEEPIRKGRYWPVGNTPLSGGRILSWVPNWYRRLKSKWQYTDVLYGSEDEYFAHAPIPTPTHPLAPLRRYVTDRYYLEEKHYRDRPYLITGDIPELVELPVIGPMLTFVSRLIKPQKRMHPEVWKMIESGITPQPGAAPETYIPPEELEKGRPAGEGAYLVPREELREELGLVDEAAGVGEEEGEAWNLEAVHAPEAWGRVGGRPDVVVAVIDTGVDTNHPDLTGKLYKGHSTLVGPALIGKEWEDRYGHGTHVAGIIAAIGNNHRGVAGAAWPAVKILPIKALSDKGIGSERSIAEAIEYAINWRGPRGERVSVINMSLGSPGIHDRYADLIKKAYDAGITVVISAGNENAPASGTPAVWPEAISVGAVEEGETRRGKTGIERAPYSNYGVGVDVTAPGSRVRSTFPGGRYAEMSGTSMAAPHVAAAAALLKAVRPDLTPDEIAYLLTATSKDTGPEGKDKYYGAGVIDIGYALAVADDLSDREREELRKQGEMHHRNIEAQRYLLLNYIKNRDAGQAVGEINRRIMDQYGRRVVQPDSLRDLVERFWTSVTEVGGFYGFTVETLTNTDESGRRKYETRMADSRALTSFRRQFWNAEIGGFGGDVNEILRRFIGKRERWEWMWNPVPNCLVPDSIVLNGELQPILVSDVKVGDVLHGASGPVEVKMVHTRYTREPVYCVKTQWLGNYGGHWLTGEHPVLAIRTAICHHHPERRIVCHPNRKYAKCKQCGYNDFNERRYGTHRHYEDYKPEWIPVAELRVGDFVGFPIHRSAETLKELDIASIAGKEYVLENGSLRNKGGRHYISIPDGKIPLDYTFGFICGLYLAEGSRTGPNGGCLGFALHNGERSTLGEYIRQFFESYGSKVSFGVSGNSLKVVVYSKLWYRVFNSIFGSGARSKRIPGWILREAPLEFLTGLFHGYFEGDGSIADSRNKIKICTYSASIVYGLRAILLQLGVLSAIHVGKRNGYILTVYSEFEEKLLERLNSAYGYKVARKKAIARKTRKSGIAHMFIGDYVFIPVVDILVKPYEGEVYDLTVEPDHAFALEGFLVHNCMPSWIPEDYFVDYHHGDPYVKTGPYGEINLPGGGYEALHPMPEVEAIKSDKLLREADKEGLINRFEFYPPFERFRILAHVAPWSDAYRYYSKLVSQMKLTREQQEEAKQIRKQAREQKKPLRLYPYRFLKRKLKTEEVTVERIIDQNTILTKEYPGHPVRLAGVHVTQDKSDKASALAMAWLEEHIPPGSRIRIRYDPEQKYAEDTYETIRAVVEIPVAGGYINLAQSMLKQGLAAERENDWSAPAVENRFSEFEQFIGALWERIAHLDTPVNTKLLQVRSPYEDWVRREVYGKNLQQWQHPFEDYLVPTYQSFISKPLPVAIGLGAVLGALFARTEGLLFNRSRYGMVIGAAIGGAITGAGALYRTVYELMTGEKWIPPRRRREWELEGYLDVLKYIKYRRLYEHERQEALTEDHFDVQAYLEEKKQEGELRKQRIEDLLEAKRLLYIKGDKVNPHWLVEHYDITLLPRVVEEGKEEARETDEEFRKRVIRSINAELAALRQARPDETGELPAHARRALQFYQQMKSTMYGYEPGEPLENFLAALPKKERRYFPYFMKMPREEYEKLKEVVPGWLLYGLAPMRGEAPPPKPDLEEYFEHHFLPDEDWEGWLPGVSMNDVRVKLVQHEGLDAAEFDIWPEDVARAKLSPVRAPKRDKPALHGERLKEELRRLLSGMGVDDIQITAEPAESGVYIDVDLDIDQSGDLTEAVSSDPMILLRS